MDLTDLKALVCPGKALSSRCPLQSAAPALLLRKCLVDPSGSHGSGNHRMLLHHLCPKGCGLPKACRIAQHAAALSMARQVRYQIARVLSGIAKQLDECTIIYGWDSVGVGFSVPVSAPALQPRLLDLQWKCRKEANTHLLVFYLRKAVA